MTAAISFGLDVEQIEEMNPALLAGAIKSTMEREQQVVASMLAMMGAARMPRK